MTDIIIKAADGIVKHATMEGFPKNYAKGQINDEIWEDAYQREIPREDVIPVEDEHLDHAAKILRDKGFLEMPEKETTGYYTLTLKGDKFKARQISIRDLLKEEDEAEVKRIAKEERDDEIKNLQYKDLNFKVEKINQEQLNFWAAQRAKNVQTTVIAIIGIVFSLVALLKAFGFFD